MKKLIKLSLSLLLIGATSGCDDPATFAIKDVGTEKLNAESDQEVEALPKPIPEKSKGASFALTIKDYSLTERVAHNAQLVFVIDNSASMADNIARLQLSLPTLFAKLKDADQPFNIRFLGMDRLLDQLVEYNGEMFPVGMGPGKPVWNRGALDDLYANIPVYTSKQSLAEIMGKLAENFSSGKPFDNEPGIMLAVDYFNWLKAHSDDARVKNVGFAASDRIHFVALSDENNAKEFLDFDKFNGTVKSSKPLYFYASRENNASCSNKAYDRSLTFDQYCYSYQASESVNRHTGTYNLDGKCKLAGFADGSSDEFLQDLTSTRWAATTRYNCSKETYATQYQCNLGGQVRTSTVNKAGLKQCFEPASYNCRAAQKVYDCAAAAPYTNSYSGLTAPFNKQRCELAQTFSCVLTVDNQPFTQSGYTRAQVSAILAQYPTAQCQPQAQSAWLAADVDAAPFGARNCQAYTCSDRLVDQVMTRANAVAFMSRPEGGSCTPVANSGTLKDFLANQDERFLTSCQSYTDCAPVTVVASTTNVQLKAAAYELVRNQPEYKNCSAVTVRQQMYGARVSGSLQGINELPGADETWVKESGAAYTLSAGTQLCAANISANKATWSGAQLVDISAANSVKVSPRSQTLIAYQYDYPQGTTKTEALIKTEKLNALIPANRVATVTTNGDLKVQAVLTGNVTNYGGANLCYTYRKYLPGDSFAQSKENFTEVKTSFVDKLDDGSLILPPAANRINGTMSYPIAEVKIYRAGGRYNEQVCQGGDYDIVKYAPTAAEFTKFMRTENAATPFTWHSIIYNAACAAQNDAGASIGEEYSLLSSMTNGVTAGICQASYDNFINEVSVSVLTEIQLKYTVEAQYVGKTPIRVENTTRGKTLLADVDYRIVGDSIVFIPTVISKNDSIAIWYP